MFLFLSTSELSCPDSVVANSDGMGRTVRCNSNLPKQCSILVVYLTTLSPARYPCRDHVTDRGSRVLARCVESCRNFTQPG